MKEVVVQACLVQFSRKCLEVFRSEWKQNLFADCDAYRSRYFLQTLEACRCVSVVLVSLYLLLFVPQPRSQLALVVAGCDTCFDKSFC